MAGRTPAGAGGADLEVSVREPAPRCVQGPVVAVMLDYYLPGYRAGGPVRTVENIVSHLGAELRFEVVTRDRDLGEPSPYPGVEPGVRGEVNGAGVTYLRPSWRMAGALRRAITRVVPDLLYLNSLFSPAFSQTPLLLRAAGLIPRTPVVLAPRGELSPGALALKAPKKRAFLAAARASGLYRNVVWQASAEEEAEQVRRWFGAAARVVVAPDLPPRAAPPALEVREKRPGALRAVFLSRISRKKNLDGALRLLAGIEGEISLEVYGPEEDAGYAAECRALAATLAPGVRVAFRGPISPDEVPARLAEHHLFLFPTRGENFGHVVLEALLAGCLPLLSDRTPWRGLEEAGAGWDLPLEEPERLRGALREAVLMDDETFRRRSVAARRLGEAFAADPAIVDRTRRLLSDAAAPAP